MKRKIIIAGLIIIALIVGVVMWRNNRQSKIEESRLEAARQREMEKMAPGINGMDIPAPLAQRRPIAVMIENHPDSRPQAGLSDADVVYETLAEGGITRFLALFQSKDPKAIGPVRSTRPYFNLIADQWGAVLAHSGGSQSALKELSIGFYKNLSDADEMLNGKYYYRDSKKFAPHNLFSSGEQLRKLLTDRKITDWKPEPMFVTKAIPTSELKTTITEVTIPFSTASYLVNYKFDSTTNTYARAMGTKPFIDANNQQTIHAKNVIVQFAAGNVIPGDPKLAMEFKLDRSGKAYLFTGGILTPGNWKYQSGKTVYTDNAGNPLTLQPGPTWIEIVPANMQNNVTWK